MSKKSIEHEEAALFRNNVGEIKPLKQDKYCFPPKKKALFSSSPKTASPDFYYQTYLNLKDWLDAQDSVHFAKSGLQYKLIQRLKQGHVPIEATIDLHRQTIDKAVKNVSRFINDCTIDNKRWILIIHGKGNFSVERKPVLKNFLNQWLRNQSDILAFHSAPSHYGGTGALIILLKKRRYREK